MTARPEGHTAALLAQTRLRVDPRTFVIVGIPSIHEASLRGALAGIYAPFFVQMFPHEQTLVLPEDEWRPLRAKFSGAREEPRYHLITLDVVLEWEVTGYLAAVTGALAQAGIPVGVLSSFHHDHLLVRDVHLAGAEAALERLIEAARDLLLPAPGSRGSLLRHPTKQDSFSLGQRRGLGVGFDERVVHIVGVGCHGDAEGAHSNTTAAGDICEKSVADHRDTPGRDGPSVQDSPEDTGVGLHASVRR